MTIRILPEGALPRRLEAGAAALDWMDGDPPFDRRELARFRRAGYPVVAPYRLLAVEGSNVLGKLIMLRLTITSEEGRIRATGIAAVVADPAAHGRGVGARLLRRAHALEAARGSAYSLLWTHVSWGAHRLYERLGYTDVFSPPTATRRGGRRGAGLSPPYSIGPVRLGDAGRLDRLHRRATRDRWGVLPRRMTFAMRFGVGRRLPQNYRFLLERGRPVGYLELRDSAAHLGVSEAVAVSERHLGALVDAAEELAGKRWLTFGYGTFVREAGEILRERGFHLTEGAHSVLMARPLRRGRSREALVAWARDPRFSSQNGDRF